MKRPTAQEYKTYFSTPTGMALIIYFLFTALIGMFIPSDVLTANAWAREFSDFMASIVPQIDRITALGIKPDVNRFYFSLLWAMSPILISLIFFDALMRKNNHPVWRATAGNVLFTVIVAVCLVFAANNIYWMDAAEGSRAKRILNFYFETSLGRGSISNIMYTSGPASFAGGALVAVCSWLTRHIASNIRK
jgi:hypothetical protein